MGTGQSAASTTAPVVLNRAAKVGPDRIAGDFLNVLGYPQVHEILKPALPSVNSRERMVVCRCWLSLRFPYCDNTHQKLWKQGINVGPCMLQFEHGLTKKNRLRRSTSLTAGGGGGAPVGGGVAGTTSSASGLGSVSTTGIPAEVERLVEMQQSVSATASTPDEVTACAGIEQESVARSSSETATALGGSASGQGGPREVVFTSESPSPAAENLQSDCCEREAFQQAKKDCSEKQAFAYANVTDDAPDKSNAMPLLGLGVGFGAAALGVAAQCSFAQENEN
ncbi:unnamed protein product [Amoebophrya sp. A120]|nr:unnamed protein product [Amoebophrya sp. A120]|eukprot:GSA120T00024095001.1